MNWLLLQFGTPVYVSHLRVWELANPASAAGFITSIDLIEPSGTEHQYTIENGDQTACGSVLTAHMPRTTSYLVDTIRLNTRTLGFEYEYIDAARCAAALQGVCFSVH